MLEHEKRLEPVVITERGSSFGALIERLLDDVMRLLDQKLALLTLELKEHLATTGKNAGMLAAGGMVAGMGVLLLGIALAVWVGGMIGSEAGGYAAVGAALALVGGGILAAMTGRLRRQRFVPRKTVQELKRDVTWIKNEL